MIDKETYKKELKRMFDSLSGGNKSTDRCGIKCSQCPLKKICNNNMYAFDVIEAVEKWSKEHPPKKYKVSELEYYLLELCVFNHMNVLFGTSSIICYLLRRGYFKGANENMLISEYFENCEIEVDE